MTLVADQSAKIRDCFARATNAEVEAFSRNELTITSRPEPPPWPFTAMAVGFGTGVVLCVEERFVDWAEAQALIPHHRAYYLGYALASEARRRGESLHAGPPILGWALTERPPARTFPAGHRLERVDRDWMTAWQKRNAFHNALGAPEQMHRTFRNQFACVLFDDAGEPLAVAGVYDTAGLSEIGVDVRRDHRGGGLGPIVVGASAGAILDEGKTPFYECAVTNIRSQRTALASGFMPVCSTALVYQSGLGIADTG